MARWKAYSRLSIRLNWIFSLSVTVPELRGNVYSSAVFTGVDLLAFKFYLDRVIPINHSWHHRKLETLGYPMVKTAFFCIPSF